MTMRLAAALGIASALALLAPVSTAGEIAIGFVDPPVRPAADIPADSRHAGSEPDPDASKGGSRGNISMRIVRDLRDRGPFSTFVAGRIVCLDVTWADAGVFKGHRETEDFLRRLLTVPRGHTLTHLHWAQRLPVPSVVATVHHAQGDRGSWHVWYSWPSIYAAYRDGQGTWWFSHWIDVEALRIDGTTP